MKILIFNGSPRKNGFTSKMIRAFTGHFDDEIRVIDVYRCDVSPCMDCRYCRTNSECAIRDEMQDIYACIDAADVIVIASPIYFAQLTGPMLSVMSRLQFFWNARMERKEELLTNKKRIGTVLLCDGGMGKYEQALAMSKRLLSIMHADPEGYVYISGTDKITDAEAELTQEQTEQIRVLAERVNVNIKENFM